MKLKHIVAAIYIMIFCGMIPVSCTRTNCGGGPVKDFQINTFISFTADINGNSMDSTNYYDADSLGIAIRPDKVTYVQNTPYDAPVPMFITEAMACSPREPMSTNKISKIQVTARSAFTYYSSSDSVKVGDDISDRFMFRNFSSMTFYPIANVQSSSVANTPSDIMMLKFAMSPFQATDCRFDIIIEMDDNTKQTFYNMALRVD